MRKLFSQIIGHVRMASGETFTRRTAVKITLAAMPRQLFNRSEVNSRVPITSAHHEAHRMAFLRQLSVKSFNV